MFGAIIQKSKKDKCKGIIPEHIMQFISPFYDENSRRSIDLKYEKVNIGK